MLILTFESGGYPFDITIAQAKIREFLSCEMGDLYLQVCTEGSFLISLTYIFVRFWAIRHRKRLS